MASDVADGNQRLIPCARAKFDFIAKSEIELSFSAGVSLRLLRRIDENWLEGELEGKVGIFPASFVDIELSIPSKTRENELAKSGRPYAIGLYEFSGDYGGDLQFAKGELIELLCSVGSGWMRGKTAKREGIFPASFVDILKLPVASCSESSSPMNSPLQLYHKDSRQQSPEYAIPGENIVESGNDTSSHTIPDTSSPMMIRERERLEAVFENGFSDDDECIEESGNCNETETQPIPTPRIKYKTRSMTSSDSTGDERQIPSRTPPAPPSSTTPKRQLYHSSTMPRPKPRRIFSRNASLTDLQKQVNTLQSGLTIEKKLLHSATNLLKLSEDEVKKEKLKASIATHENNVKSLKLQLQELKAQRESISESYSSSPPPLRPSSPPQQQLTHTKPPSLAQQRAMVIEELVTTEADYHNQMLVCCDKLIPAMKEIREVNSDLLFGNLHEVTCVSHDLLAALRDMCETGEDKVGVVFVKFGPRLRTTYAVYCRNHDNASTLVEKYLENVDLMKKIKEILDAIRAETQAWDLQSLLIKPVQRVLKYPLLLDKLVQATSDKHVDYKHIHMARETVAHVAQDINEIKRRKDLVERYTGAGKDERRGTMSVHSLQKKVRRFQQTLTQLTGLRSKTVDPIFEELEQKLTSLELFLRQLIRNVITWQEDIQKSIDSHEIFSEGMALYVPSDVRPLTSYRHGVTELQHVIKNHSGLVNTHVLIPFQSLLALFQDPLHLISKRRDKLLDYDHLQYALDHHTEDPEKIRQLRDGCTMAKRNYEALNVQLIEELPHFIHLARNMINHTVTVLVQLQCKLHTAIHNVLEQLVDDDGTSYEDDLSCEMIKERHCKSLSEVAGQLIVLSIVPTSLMMSLPVTVRMQQRRISVEEEGEGEESILSTSSEVDMDNSIIEEPFEPHPPVVGTQLMVMYDFEAQDKAELNVSAGHIVILKCPHDRIGCTEWCLVESQHGIGYVPASFLEYHGNTDT